MRQLPGFSGSGGFGRVLRSPFRLPPATHCRIVSRSRADPFTGYTDTGTHVTGTVYGRTNARVQQREVSRKELCSRDYKSRSVKESYERNKRC